MSCACCGILVRWFPRFPLFQPTLLTFDRYYLEPLDLAEGFPYSAAPLLRCASTPLHLYSSSPLLRCASTPLRPDIWAVNKCAHTSVFMLACSFMCLLIWVASKPDYFLQNTARATTSIMILVWSGKAKNWWNLNFTVNDQSLSSIDQTLSRVDMHPVRDFSSSDSARGMEGLRRQASPRHWIVSIESW